MKDVDQAMNPPRTSPSFRTHSEGTKSTELIGYRTERESCPEWLLTFGEDPTRAEVYAKGTVRGLASRLDRFYRRV